MKKQLKNLKKVSKGITKRMDSLGDNCRACGKEFDNRDSEALASWVVYVVDGDPRLICPACKQKIDEMSKEEEFEDARINAPGGIET